MYELNVSLTVLDRSEFESDRERGLQRMTDAGAQDPLLGEFASGLGAGGIVWSTRWPTLDAALAWNKQSAIGQTDPENPNADMRARYQMTSRNLNRVINDVGERGGGPCMTVAIARSAKPLPADENLHALETYMANGGKGASTVLSLHGDLVGCHLTGFYGDSFEQIAQAQEAMLQDSRVVAAIIDLGVTPIERLFVDIV